MRIAQVAPLYESVPPKLYGGTERIVSYLTEELVKQGYPVTLFASGDSQTKAKLVPAVPQALRLDPRCIDPLAHHVVMLNQVVEQATEFDIIHFHIDYLHFPLVRALGLRHVTTLHGRLDLPDLAPLYQEFSDVPVVSISNDQRRSLPHANWQATVYHGLPQDLYRFYPNFGQYLAFMGRVSPEKRLDRAIEIALRSGLELWIAAKVGKADQDYFKNRIRPLLNHPQVKFVGEIGEADKNAFLGNACALLFPIDWPEPFGLIMIEALACGTPVIAFARGSVPEVLRPETGFMVETVEAAVAAVERVDQLSRVHCRWVFERHFSAERMTSDYLAVYRQTLAPNVNQSIAV